MKTVSPSLLPFVRSRTNKYFCFSTHILCRCEAHHDGAAPAAHAKDKTSFIFARSIAGFDPRHKHPSRPHRSAQACESCRFDFMLRFLFLYMGKQVPLTCYCCSFPLIFCSFCALVFLFHISFYPSLSCSLRLKNIPQIIIPRVLWRL